MNRLLRLPLAILATYRLALMLSQEDGPLFAFARLRAFSDRKRKGEQDRTRRRLGLAEDVSLPGENDWGPWASLDNGLRCTWCVGVWAAALCAALVRRPGRVGDALLTWLGISGGQLFLERWQE